MVTWLVRLGLVVGLTVAVPVPGWGDPPAEDIPAPRPIPGPELTRPLVSPPLAYLPPVPPEFGKRSVWQFYGVDRSGRFRLLVIQSPYGAYYRYNGDPFPWASVQPAPYMPYVVGD
jgi:hypothetical protein